jgi:hypothetical protein
MNDSGSAARTQSMLLEIEAFLIPRHRFAKLHPRPVQTQIFGVTEQVEINLPIVVPVAHFAKEFDVNAWLLVKATKAYEPSISSRTLNSSESLIHSSTKA